MVDLFIILSENKIYLKDFQKPLYYVNYVNKFRQFLLKVKRLKLKQIYK